MQWLVWVCCLAIATITGCGGKSEPRRVAVRGSVMVGDQLVPKATVRFLPDKGNTGSVVYASVVGGLYNFTKLDGPTPGRYKVLVNLELGSVTKMAREDSNVKPPPSQWEQDVTVPDEESATQHFLWKSASERDAEAKDKSN